MRSRRHPLWFLENRDAFVQRFVLAEVLGPPRRWIGRPAPRPAPAPPKEPVNVVDPRKGPPPEL